MQNALCQVQSKLYLDSARFTGGMSFRVSRAKYYVASSQERMPDLDISRIPPYQSYEGFIRRRLYATFEYISDIGDRASRLSTRISRLLDAIQAKALVDLTHNIEKLSQATALQTQKLAEISGQEHIQTTVLYLIAIIGFGGLLLHSILWGTIFPNQEAKSAAISYVVSGLIAFLFILYRKMKKPKKQNVVKKGN